jgi:hypothetical protein
MWLHCNKFKIENAMNDINEYFFFSHFLSHSKSLALLLFKNEEK